MELHEYEVALLKFLEPGKRYGLLPTDGSKYYIIGQCKLNADAIKRTVGWLKEKGLITVEQRTRKSVKIITDEGKRYQKEGYPEYTLTKKVLQKNGISLKDSSILTPLEKSVGIPWAKKKGWITIKEGKIIPLIDSLPKVYKPSDDENVKRKLIIIKQSSNVLLSLTDKGISVRNMILKGNIKIGGVTLLTDKMLKTGGWRGKSFRKYNVTAESSPVYPGKRHALSRLSETIKKIFIELGFEEMEGPILESSFWVFDALFQPQDHPARELADTFYINKKFMLCDNETPKEIVDVVKSTHEKGWGYKWSEEVSRKGILRCHTTSLSAKTLFHKVRGTTGPKKYFAIGKVYRNEAVDYKHLAEFHQVEGIIISEDMKFKHLLGVLKEFYKKLGFDKVKFYPSYFPYTEPSVEIYVYFPEKKEWIEMGGAGIFRPEVSIPLCGRYPVLAFGLSLERPLMLLTDLKDIRMPYYNRIDWLRRMTYKEIE